jgi:hypothetical protein
VARGQQVALATYLFCPSHDFGMSQCETGNNFLPLRNIDINMYIQDPSLRANTHQKYFNETEILLMFSCNGKIALLSSKLNYFCYTCKLAVYLPQPTCFKSSILSFRLFLLHAGVVGLEFATKLAHSVSYPTDYRGFFSRRKNSWVVRLTTHCHKSFARDQ